MNNICSDSSSIWSNCGDIQLRDDAHALRGQLNPLQGSVGGAQPAKDRGAAQVLRRWWRAHGSASAKGAGHAEGDARKGIARGDIIAR